MDFIDFSVVSVYWLHCVNVVLGTHYAKYLALCRSRRKLALKILLTQCLTQNVIKQRQVKICRKNKDM